MDRLAVTFNGTDRFQLLRVLGHGGMGVVYEALDKNHGMRVALKVLPMVSPERLLRFKREFRVASSIDHPNLVRLGELVRFGDHWFFTMELVQGVDVLEHVRGSAAAPVRSGPRTLAWSSDDATRAPDAASALAHETAASLGDVGKLRLSLSQLASALRALHDAGCVHRDIKPSNVLVTTDGRVVLLDFGLASVTALESTLFVAGTPLYMAPEQAASVRVTPAADWYSFGVLLFELLTGTLPFRGHMYEVLSAKQGERAPSVASVLSGAPPDLVLLCDELLAMNPEQRPTGDQVLARLGAPPLQRPPRGHTPRRTGSLVGREREWSTLQAALRKVEESGRSLTLVLSGESGVGKSTLARAFLDAQASDPAVLTFFSRCYERELVPYKAVDGLLDAIAHFLRHAPDALVDRVLPARAGVIAQVFPVLARVEALARTTQPDLSLDRREVRTWLFAALRELLANIGREKLLVVLIDDLHWADNDSMTLLSELLREPGSPRLLLLCTLRTQGPPQHSQVFSREVNEELLTLGNLAKDAAETLARELASAHERPIDCARLAEESQGHPLFLRELLDATLDDEAPGAFALTLEGVLSQRIAGLAAEPAKLLSLLSISGSPLESSVLREACGLEGPTFTDALHTLRAHRFIHAAGEIFDDRLDISHDRVRKVLRASLSKAEVEALHQLLARALELRGDPVLSATHWREAQHPERAAQHYASAGRMALDALAFGDAASHYRAALSLGNWPARERMSLLSALGDALSNAGKGAEAAEHYRSAASASQGTDAVELKRRAAEELVRGGHLDEGLTVAREVLADADLEPSKAPLYALLFQRSLLRLRGLGFREQKPEDVPPKELARIDLCWSMSSGLVLTDTVQGMYFQARGLALSLRAGEPYRVSRSVAAEGAYTASRGLRARKRAVALLDTAEELAVRTKDPRAVGTALLMRGIACHFFGEFSEGRTLLHRASAVFREQCTGMFWERDAARQFWTECSFYLGDLSALRETVISGLREARDRSAMYTATNLRIGLANAVWLIDDAPERAARELSDAMQSWSMRGFHVQHWYALIAETHIALYDGRGRDALGLLDARWPELAHSHLLRVNHTRIVALHLSARASLLAASAEAAHGRRAAHIERARHTLRRLRRNAGSWAELLADLIELGATQLEGKRAAQSELDALSERLVAAHLNVYALSLRALAFGEDSGLRALGVKAPRKFASMLVPGLVSSASG
jgi:eukaryotic-like serine/threonine-protein kinase